MKLIIIFFVLAIVPFLVLILVVSPGADSMKACYTTAQEQLVKTGNQASEEGWDAEIVCIAQTTQFEQLQTCKQEGKEQWAVSRFGYDLTEQLLGLFHPDVNRVRDAAYAHNVACQAYPNTLLRGVNPTW